MTPLVTIVTGFVLVLAVVIPSYLYKVRRNGIFEEALEELEIDPNFHKADKIIVRVEEQLERKLNYEEKYIISMTFNLGVKAGMEKAVSDVLRTIKLKQKQK